MSAIDRINGATLREKTYRGHTFKFAAVDRIQGDPSWWSFTDEDSVRDAFWDVREGDVVFDIGAAYGSYAFTALACGAAHVFAWSPQGHPGAPLTEKEAGFMRATAEANGWPYAGEAPRLSIYEEGIYSASGYLNTRTQMLEAEAPDVPNDDVIKVRPFSDWWGDEIVFGGLRESTWAASLLESLRGKRVMPGDLPHQAHWKQSRIWVKIDVEGAELAVLSGILGPLVSRYEPNILVENHNFKNEKLEDFVRDEVMSWGYRHVGTQPYHSVSHSFFTP